MVGGLVDSFESLLTNLGLVALKMKMARLREEKFPFASPFFLIPS